MSDWAFLNKARVKQGPYASTDLDGFNGAFGLRMGTARVVVIASDGEGWQHVSVSINNSRVPPPWDIMCKIKDLFWEPEDWVVQFHPAASEYVNNHSGCLHLWKPLKEKLPTPPSILVGIK